MAVKWAVANGSWSAGATWNDGVVPTSDDDVYANGCVITSMPTQISVKSLRNDSNNDLSIIAGGYFSQTINGSTTIITANIISVNNYCVITGVSTNANGTITINGDIHCSNTIMAISTSNVNRAHTFIVNGNVTIGDGCAIFGSNYGTWSFVIVGNMSADSNAYIYNGTQNNAALTRLTYAGNITNITWSSVAQTITTCNGSGNWQVPTSQTVTTATITGDVILKANTTFTTANITGAIVANGFVLSCTTLNLNGNITYIGTNGKTGVRYTTLNILNPSTFTWKDILEPRLNPFLIVTEGELNDTYLYPSTSVVRDGIQYAANQRIGTYRPDYPIPQNVMKDVEYDSGLLIGTLEFPQVPTTSDIVTAIKNDSDLGVKINTTNTNVGNMSTAVTTIDGKVDIIDTNVDTLLSRLTSVLTQRLGQSVTVEILQQILDAHLNN